MRPPAKPSLASEPGGCGIRGLQLSLWDEAVAVAPSAPPNDARRSNRPLTWRSSESPQALEEPPHRPALPNEALSDVFDRVFRRLRPGDHSPRFHASFRTFTGLRSVIHIKGKNNIQAELSDLLTEASPLVLEAIAEILITRVFRLRTSREARECYKAWANSPAVVRRVDEIRRERGRKRLLLPQGSYFDLSRIFEDLNRRFFAGQIGPVRIGWSPNRSRTMLGHYDDSHRTITITRWLDGPRVPRYVVEYLVFHEMLHVRFPVERRNHRRVVHSAAFCAAERGFPDYARAARWLRNGGKTGGAVGDEPPWQGVPSI